MRSQKQLYSGADSDPLALLQAEFEEKYQEVLITYFIALHYAQDNSIKQALVILQSCQYKLEETIEFAQQNGLKGDRIDSIMNELSTEILQKVEFAMCKCQARFLQQSHSTSENAKMLIEASGPQKQIKYDNVYDMIYSQGSKAKLQENLSKQVRLGDTKSQLNFLENSNQLVDEADPSLQDNVDLSKVKINKQFRLISTLPKLQSVPATPQFFDIAGGYISYPSAEVEAEKYKVQGGLFQALGGLFG